MSEVLASRLSVLVCDSETPLPAPESLLRLRRELVSDGPTSVPVEQVLPPVSHLRLGGA